MFLDPHCHCLPTHTPTVFHPLLDDMDNAILGYLDIEVVYTWETALWITDAIGAPSKNQWFLSSFCSLLLRKWVSRYLYKANVHKYHYAPKIICPGQFSNCHCHWRNFLSFQIIAGYCQKSHIKHWKRLEKCPNAHRICVSWCNHG